MHDRERDRERERERSRNHRVPEEVTWTSNSPLTGVVANLWHDLLLLLQDFPLSCHFLPASLWEVAKNDRQNSQDRASGR